MGTLFNKIKRFIPWCNQEAFNSKAIMKIGVDEHGAFLLLYDGTVERGVKETIVSEDGKVRNITRFNMEK